MLRRIITLAVVYLALAGSVLGQPLLDALGQALDHAEANRWSEAEDGFLRAARLDPADALAYVGAGLSLLARSQPDAAAPWFRRAIVCGGADAVAYTGLGVSAVAVGDGESADRYLAQALANDAQLGAASYYRALLAITRNELVSAGDLIASARANGVADAFADNLEALRQMALNQPERAATLLSQAAAQADLAVRGLPGALPLSLVEGSPTTSRFRLTLARTLGDAVQPALAPLPPVPVEPARNGALTITQPLPQAVVAGRVTIRAAVLGARDYSFVSFSVDGRVQAITNREPFYAVWDTSQFADGEHLISVRAVGSSEVVAELTVTLRNRPIALAAGVTSYDTGRYRSLTRRLAALMVHRAPPVAIDELRLSSLAAGQPAEALKLVDRILAKDPQRADLVPTVLDLTKRAGLAHDPLAVGHIVRGVTGQRRIALTFDDGPRPGYTEPLLAQLAAHHMVATFMLTGQMSDLYPELVRSIGAAGHEIGSHTYSHFRLDTLTPEQQVIEMSRARAAIDTALGRESSRIMRPPGGRYNDQIRSMLAAVGYQPIFWTINCGSYATLSPSEAADSVMRNMVDGAILLLHTGPDNTLSLLPELLPRIAAAGYRCVTVSELIRGLANHNPNWASITVPLETWTPDVP